MLQTLAVQVTASIQSQGIVNLTTTKALDAIISQLDDHTRQIGDHRGALGLMREFLAQVHRPTGPFEADKLRKGAGASFALFR